MPAYCLRAKSIERAFGVVHDKCTRNHKRACLAELVSDVKEHRGGTARGAAGYRVCTYAPEVEAAGAETSAAELKAA